MDTNFSHDVFISFSFKDQTQAENLVNLLSSTYGISCWICTRDVHGGNRYKKLIPEAIDHAKVVVFLQSASSVQSREIPKEIGMAFDGDKTIIPFKLDDAMLTGDLRYDLYGLEFIDGTIPTFSERVAELARAIRNVIGERQPDPGLGEKLMSTPAILPKTVFCGRKDVLRRIDAHFQEGGRVLFLQGIGGIGKTQIAKQYAKQYKDRYDTVIYATYNGSIQDLVVAKTPFEIQPELVRYTLPDGTIEQDRQFFERKLAKIQRLSTERTLIILDNFDVDEDGDLPALLNGNYRLLVTTRCDYSHLYPAVRIEPLEDPEDLKGVFMGNYRGLDVDPEDPALVKLIELVSRHTYTMELLAQHMENSGQTPSEMIRALTDQGIHALDEEIRDGEMKTRIAYENLLKMFKVFSLSEEERRVLMYLSLMPIVGVKGREFREWAQMKSSRLLRTLENRSWIMRNTEGIALHPIIRAVIRHEISADEENCFEFYSRFGEVIQDGRSWNYKKSEKDRYAVIAKSLLAQFSEITPRTEMLYFHGVALFSFSVDPEYAVELAQRLYHYYRNRYGKDSYEAGLAAYKLGWIYGFNTQLPNPVSNGLKWLKIADGIFETLGEMTHRQKLQMTQIKMNLAKLKLAVYQETKDVHAYEEAKDYARAPFGLFMPGGPEHNRLAGTYLQLADILRTGGEFREALEHDEEAIRILIWLGLENSSDMMSALGKKARILFEMGCYEQAKPVLAQSLAGYIEFFGELSPTVVGMHELLGDCCLILGERKEGEVAFRKGLEIAQKLYAPGAHQIETLQRKVAQC